MFLFYRFGKEWDYNSGSSFFSVAHVSQDDLLADESSCLAKVYINIARGKKNVMNWMGRHTRASRCNKSRIWQFPDCFKLAYKRKH